MKKEEKKNIFIILLLSLLIIGLTLYAYWRNNFLNFNYFLGTDKLGHFGDFIGGFLGTILTGLATYLVYKTYISQKEELELQRKLIAQQQFETTFFNMLNVHRELKSGLRLFNDDRLYLDKNKIGDELVSFFKVEFKNYFKHIKNNTNNPPGTIQNFDIEQIKLNLENKIDNDYKIVKEIFNNLFKRIKVLNYLKYLYIILKFIRENEIKNKEEYKKYIDMFQILLNEDEQFILFYYFIIFNNQDDKELSTIKICNHYKLFEDIGKDNLIDIEHCRFFDFEIK